MIKRPRLGKRIKSEDMEDRFYFQDYAIVVCSTLNVELNYLRDSGFLDARRILYIKPGHHKILRELESQLIRQIGTAKKYASNIIVVYGGKFCYANAANPYRKIDTIIQEHYAKLLEELASVPNQAWKIRKVIQTGDFR